MSLAPRFLNVEVAQMLQRSLFMREIKGRCPASPIFQRSREMKKGNTRSCFVRPKDDMDLYVQYAKGSIWNSTEPDEKAINAPNRPDLSQKDVEWNITLLISEQKTPYKKAPLDTTSEVSHSKGPAIGMWETHGLMSRIDKANFRTICNKRLRSTIALTEKIFSCH